MVLFLVYWPPQTFGLQSSWCHPLGYKLENPSDWINRFFDFNSENILWNNSSTTPHHNQVSRKLAVYNTVDNSSVQRYRNLPKVHCLPGNLNRRWHIFALHFVILTKFKRQRAFSKPKTWVGRKPHVREWEMLGALSTGESDCDRATTNFQWIF